MRRRSGAMAMVLACFGFTGTANAGDFALSAGGGVEYSSNPAHLPQGGPHDTIRSVFAGLYYRERTPEFSALVNGRAEYRDYREDTFGDDVISDLDAFVTWGIVPQTFVWRFVDRAHQATINPLVADTPANRTDTNIFATGPDFRVRFGPRNHLLVGARAGDVGVQDSVGGSDLDNNRYSAHGGWQYELSAATRVSLNYSGIKVNYDDPVANENFTRHDYFVQVLGRPGLTRYELDLGTTRIYRDIREPLGGRLARLLFARQISSNQDIRLRMAGEFSDTGAELSPLVDPESWEGAVTLLAPVLTTDVFYSRRADLMFNRTGLLSMSIRGGWRQLDYETVPDDRQEVDALVDFGYRLSNRTTTGIAIQYWHTEWQERDRTDSRYGIWLRLGWIMNRYVTANFWLRRDSQDSTDYPNNYMENLAGFNVMYRSSPASPAR